VIENIQGQIHFAEFYWSQQRHAPRWSWVHSCTFSLSLVPNIRFWSPLKPLGEREEKTT